MRFAVPFMTVLTLGVTAMTGPATADTALILSNLRYEAAPNLRAQREIRQIGDALETAGFEVIEVGNGDGREMRAGLARLIASDETDRVLIVAMGHFVRGARDSWLLASDADRPDLARVDLSGISVSLLADVAAAVPGRAVLALATEDAAIETGPGLERGIGRIDPPQGVTVLGGGPRAIADIIRGPLLTPGTDLPAVLGAFDGVQAVGFLSSAVPFIDAPGTAPAPSITADRDLWRAMDAIGSAEAYRAYLDRFPRGEFAEIARARLDALDVAAPQVRENALGLSRDDRRQLQRYLTILGFDTGGIDGVFGPATRRAISDWQRARGVAPTGFLDASTLGTLRGEGEIREAVLAEERRNLERQDRAYWQQTGAGRSVAGIEAYLERYPNGLFAQEGRDILANRAEAEVDRAWAAARNEDTVGAYRAFIRTYPDAPQVGEARRRIRDLEFSAGVDDETMRRARESEASLNLAPISKLLVERRLAVSGFDPGPIDGAFDDRTRRAIAAYQESRGMVPTGYVDDVMLATILAMSLGDIIRQ